MKAILFSYLLCQDLEEEIPTKKMASKNMNEQYSKDILTGIINPINGKLEYKLIITTSKPSSIPFNRMEYLFKNENNEIIINFFKSFFNIFVIFPKFQVSPTEGPSFILDKSKLSEEYNKNNLLIYYNDKVGAWSPLLEFDLQLGTNSYKIEIEVDPFNLEIKAYPELKGQKIVVVSKKFENSEILELAYLQVSRVVKDSIYIFEPNGSLYSEKEIKLQFNKEPNKDGYFSRYIPKKALEEATSNIKKPVITLEEKAIIKDPIKLNIFEIFPGKPIPAEANVVYLNKKFIKVDPILIDELNALKEEFLEKRLLEFKEVKLDLDIFDNIITESLILKMKNFKLDDKLINTKVLNIMRACHVDPMDNIFSIDSDVKELTQATVPTIRLEELNYMYLKKLFSTDPLVLQNFLLAQYLNMYPPLLLLLKSLNPKTFPKTEVFKESDYLYYESFVYLLESTKGNMEPDFIFNLVKKTCNQFALDSKAFSIFSLWFLLFISIL